MGVSPVRELPGLAAAARGLREERLGAAALMERCLAARQAELEAYQTWRPEQAMAQAELADRAFAQGSDLGPLQGIPVSVKDLFGLTGYPTYAGSNGPLPEDWCRDGPFVARARRQLAAFTGKTRTVEFAFGGVGVNPHWPAVRNPWDRERISGGSSSGAGVSLVEGSCLLALGSDTAGSVRMPASVTGVTALKTTAGRWPLAGIVPLSPTLDTVGLLARTAEDLGFAFAALDAERPGPRLPPVDGDLAGIRIGVPSVLFFDDCDPGIAEAVHDMLKELEAAGARLVPAELPQVEEAFALFKAGSVQAAELYEFLESHFPEKMESLAELVATRVLSGKELPAVEYLRRRRTIDRLAAAAQTVFGEIDVLASPTVAITPPRFDQVAEIEDYRARNMLILRNTTMANLMGLCALTLPAGPDKAGMPVGLHLAGPAMGETRLLEIGRRIEQVAGTAEKRLGRPPLG